MADGDKTREELLLEVDQLRRQLAEARATLETREKVGLDQDHVEVERQAPVITPQVKPAGSQAMSGCSPKLIARPDTPIKILLIEDNPGDARLIQEMLTGAGSNGISLEWVPRLSQGLEYLSQGKIDLVLLDLSLPDSQGLETFCKAYTHAPEIPFVLLTGLDDETVALTAVQNGAQDYLIKAETDGHRLLRAIRYATERKQAQEALRRARDELERRVEERTADLVAVNQQLQDEIAQHRQAEAEQQRLLAEVQSSSEELRVSNEELKIQGEDLGLQNEALNAQDLELEDLAGELAAGRKLQHAVLEQMPAGVIIAEPSGRIILTNRLAEGIWGQTPNSLGDLNAFQQLRRYYPDGRAYPPEDMPLLRALTLGETVVNEEFLLQRDAGDHLQVVHLNVSATPVRDQHGSIIAAVATYTDVTGQKQAQAALRQSEERYRSLVELSPEAILVHARGKIVFVNPAAVKLFGASVRRDLLGLPLMDRMHPDYHAKIQDRIRTVQRGGTINPLEEKILRLDGESVEVEAVGSAIVYQGRPAVQVIFRDITERKRAREALRAANANLQALIEASPLAILHLDRQGAIQSCNPATERIFGWRAEELLGYPIPLGPEDKRLVSQDVIRRVFQGEQVTGLELRALRQNSAWIDVSLSGAPMYDEAGEVTGIVGLVEDITDRKQAEAALAKSRAEFEAIFNSISDAVIFANQERRIILANPAVKTVFGYKPDELFGKSAKLIYANPADFETMGQRIYRVGPVENSRVYELPYRRKDGTVFQGETVGGQVKDAQGNILGFVAIHRNITSRKIAEAALKESQRQVSMLADFLENSSQPFGVGYLDGRIGMFNEAFLQLLGYSQKELSRLNWEKDLTPPEWREREAFRLEELLRTGQPVRYEKEYLRKDGTRVPVEMFVHLRRDEQKLPIIFYAFVTDITARKEAEASLQESEARFRTIFENSAIGIALTDSNGRVLALNPSFEKSLGYCLPDLACQTFIDITHPDDVQQSRELFADLMSGRREHYHLEKRYICKDGRIMWVNLTVSLVRDAAGAPKFSVGMVEDITARKEAEEALRQAKQEWERTFDTVPDLIFILDNQHRIVRANRATAEFLGVTPTDLMGRPCYEVIHNASKPPAICPHSQMMAEGREMTMELHESGRDFMVSVTPLMDDQETITGCVHVARDITARKEAEAALEQERQRLFDLLDSLPGLVLLSGPDYSSRFANRRFIETFGNPQDKTCFQLFHQRQTPCEGCPAHLVIEDQAQHEWERTTEDGRTFQVYKYPFRDTDGTSCILTLGLDITDRKQTEDALKESEARFRQLAENLDDAILLTSADLRQVHYISPAFERIWGRSCASLYQAPPSWLQSVVAADQDKVRTALKELIAGDQPIEAFPEFRITRPDGVERWILARFFPIRNEAGDVYRIAGIATDITSRKEVEAVLRWRQEHLGQTAKMEAVGRLAGGVAHDFNNLLTVISGYGELLLADLQEADQQRQQVKAILKAADQATIVTRQLLAFSRKQMLQPQVLDLNGLIAGLVEMFRRLADENIRISMNLDPELGPVKADAGHMEQVVMNLAINAMDAMPQGGDLTIETANVQLAPKDTRKHPDIPPGAYIMVKVTDTGVGMNQEILSHIFEPFFTTKERGKGTGLGLSMAYGIIKQSNGHILVESTPQKGSTFRIYLPRMARTTKPIELAASALTQIQDTGTILLVEDEPGVRHVVQRMLALKGYSVLTAQDGQEALKVGQDHPAPIHLLLTDVAMPLMGGRELAERLAQVHPEMKVLFMSGHTEDGMVRRGVRESVINFIQKPFRADQLLHKVRKLLSHPKP
jgi:two-component system cell cycle sensor histidine kinase/response regulator CckA